MFLENQPENEQESYFKLLQAVGGLSGLFSDNLIPYLYYRSAERAFCKAFSADDMSREDSSFDAKKNGMGVGLKTFQYKNGSCLEKIAEFNSVANVLRELQSSPRDLIIKVAELRNKRIKFASNAHNINDSIYHCVTRKEQEFVFFECPLTPINIDRIEFDEQSFTSNTLIFNDNSNEYRFSLSKSTLFKRFEVRDNIINNIPVEILDDPFELIQTLLQNGHFTNERTYPSVILPLYSERDNNVPLKSGLNQWNASGRARHEDEVYIQIPAWIRHKYPDFFTPSDMEFTLELPNGQQLSARNCQEPIHIGNKPIGKALMSNPNKDLGHWLLREVLNLDAGKICTLEMLQDLNIDSIELTKISNEQYKINFCPSGTYQDYCNTYRD